MILQRKKIKVITDLTRRRFFDICSRIFAKFLPRDAMLSAVYAVVVCLSLCLSMFVCVSVTLRYFIKTAKRSITQIMPHDRVFKLDVL